MSFNRAEYKAVFDFAEEIYLSSRKPAIKRKAQEIMVSVENVIGQQRDGEQTARLGLDCGRIIR